MMNVLLTNDDGVTSEGITTLARVLSTKYNVTVVAPLQNQSAKSHSITLNKSMRLQKISKNVYGFDGTPSDCIKYALHGLNLTPDLIISGINHGHNLGADVYYSGTVCASLEGAILGFKSMAVSYCSYTDMDFEKVANFTLKMVEKLLPYLSHERIFSINYPEIPESDVKGYRFCSIGKNAYSDHYIETEKDTFMIIGEPLEEQDNEPDCDVELCKQGYITISPIKVDRTDYELLGKLI